MTMEYMVKRSLFATALIPVLFFSTGCAVVEKFGGSSEPLLDPMYDGVWTAQVESYRKTQLGPAKPGYSHTRWDCGDGEPFDFKINVNEGVVTVPGSEPINAGRISVNNAFKTIVRRSEDRTSVLSGNFKNQTGKMQNRKNELNGCYFKFSMVRDG